MSPPSPGFADTGNTEHPEEDQSRIAKMHVLRSVVALLETLRCCNLKPSCVWRGVFESHRIEDVGLLESSELTPEWSAPQPSSSQEHQTPVLMPTWLPLSQLYNPVGSPSTILPFGSAPGTASMSLWTPAGPASSTRGAGRSPSSSADTESGCECSQGPGQPGDPHFPHQQVAEGRTGWPGPKPPPVMCL